MDDIVDVDDSISYLGFEERKHFKKGKISRRFI